MLRLAIAMVVGAAFRRGGGPADRPAGAASPKGDYLAIVTLAFGEILKEVINALYVGQDSAGLHFGFNFRNNISSINDLHMEEGAKAIIKGAQGVTGNEKLATFGAGFVLILITLFIVMNLVRSRAGRAIMAHPRQPDRCGERGHQRDQVQADGLRRVRCPGRERRERCTAPITPPSRPAPSTSTSPF